MADDESKEENVDLDKFFDSLDDDIEDTNPDEEVESSTDDEMETAKAGDDQTSMSLEERLSLIEKENKGLKKDIVKVRSDRREAREKFERLHKIVEDVVSKRGSQADGKAGDKKEEDPLKDLKLPVDYDDEGHPFVPASALAELIKGQDKKIDATKREIQLREQQEALMQEAQSKLNAVLEKDETFPSAYKTVSKLVGELNSKVIEIQKEGRGPQRELRPGEAIDLLEKEGVLEEWSQEHPEVDPDIIVFAFESERTLTKALKHIASSAEKKAEKTEKKSDEVISKLTKKVSSHGKGSVDAKESLTQKVGRYAPEDILNLDDKSVKILMEKMRKEELASF